MIDRSHHKATASRKKLNKVHLVKKKVNLLKAAIPVRFLRDLTDTTG
jgi:hypothetical protein